MHLALDICDDANAVNNSLRQSQSQSIAHRKNGGTTNTDIIIRTLAGRNLRQQIGARRGAVDAVALARRIRRDRRLVGGGEGADQLLLQRRQMVDLQLQLQSGK